MRCSTVTPGKFATFCRNPVRRLNNVDLPEFGGPTMATTCFFVSASAGGGLMVITGPLWQSLMVAYSWGSQSWLPPAFSRRCARAEPPERRLQARLPAPHRKLHSRCIMFCCAQDQMPRGVAPQRHLGTIDSEHARISS